MSDRDRRAWNIISVILTVVCEDDDDDDDVSVVVMLRSGDASRCSAGARAV